MIKVRDALAPRMLAVVGMDEKAFWAVLCSFFPRDFDACSAMKLAGCRAMIACGFENLRTRNLKRRKLYSAFAKRRAHAQDATQ
jgi:hypothetical protein